MARKSKEAPKSPPTKRQISRLQKERRRRRIILVIGISVIAIIIGLVIYGVLV